MICSLFTVHSFMESFIENYKAKHRHPLNKLMHSLGIPMIVVSLPFLFFNWRWGLGLFIVGWILQFAGHAMEGNQPAFFRNPVYLLVGPWWLLRRAVAAIGLTRPSASR
ncbi:MAG: hypothetical protein QOD75_258 [Blastocatellia bacterium]|jgi:uncharacterized membrane protein YGL010W|nr:hypothetical protein [Blastocatellia bacterium]